VRKIREDAALSSLPVLAVTAYAMRGDREKTLEAGFDGYLSKPINPAALDAELERIGTTRLQYPSARKSLLSQLEMQRKG
jgi:CheY-like chemotaxis protein